ncbi:MAG: N-acetyl-gamma-glutamyl-phosphate reductase [Actinomycetia bacterium]|nr:N-acetyl-gamma-glutamyl-phosphate reductase [Actinomycetes bacterium]
MYRAAVLGASGYAGGEVVRFLDAHPSFTVGLLGANTRAGQELGAVHPQLSGGNRPLVTATEQNLAEFDVVFMALPHGASAEPAMQLLDSDTKIVDLGSDFRFDTPERYLEAYGAEHPFPAQLGSWAYGIPELFPDEISGSNHVAVPGCFPTSVVMPLAPLFSHGLLEPDGIIADALTGASGAGRGGGDSLSFGVIDESSTAYKVLTHRHGPEMERALEMVTETSVSLLFTPHLVPMQRGILATTYSTPVESVGLEDIQTAFDAAYLDAPFVERRSEPPHTRWVVGSNNLMVSFHLDERTNTLVAVSAIDNLVKGAAGQAVQCANLMFGLDQIAGLPREGWMP